MTISTNQGGDKRPDQHLIDECDPQVIDHIQSLQADNERLREALEGMLKSFGSTTAICEQARAAFNGEERQ